MSSAWVIERCFFPFDNGVARGSANFYNLNTGMHPFTGTAVERDAILGSLPAYQYERAAFRVDPHPARAICR